MQPFSVLLSRQRKAAGYPSARSFFKSQGGRRYFVCTYAQYLNAEAGRSVPGPGLFAKILSGLHLEPQTEEARRLACAYLRAMLKEPSVEHFVISALAGRDPLSAHREPLLRRAVHHGFALRKHALTDSQTEFIRRNRANFWVFAVLSHDTGEWSEGELAATTSLPLAEVRNALRGLSRHKLAAKAKGGRFTSPLVKKVLHFPPGEPPGGFGIKDLDEELEAMSRKNGKRLFTQNYFLRASEGALRALYPTLTEAVRGADIFTTHEKDSDTAFFRVQASVTKVLSF